MQERYLIIMDTDQGPVVQASTNDLTEAYELLYEYTYAFPYEMYLETRYEAGKAKHSEFF